MIPGQIEKIPGRFAMQCLIPDDGEGAAFQAELEYAFGRGLWEAIRHAYKPVVVSLNRHFYYEPDMLAPRFNHRAVIEATLNYVEYEHVHIATYDEMKADFLAPPIPIRWQERVRGAWRILTKRPY